MILFNLTAKNDKQWFQLPTAEIKTEDDLRLIQNFFKTNCQYSYVVMDYLYLADFIRKLKEFDMDVEYFFANTQLLILDNSESGLDESELQGLDFAVAESFEHLENTLTFLQAFLLSNQNDLIVMWTADEEILDLFHEQISVCYFMNDNKVHTGTPMENFDDNKQLRCCQLQVKAHYSLSRYERVVDNK